MNANVLHAGLAILIAFCVVTLGGCDRDGSKPAAQQAAKPGTSDCCQCSGKTNPNPPPAYTLDPDCNPTGWTNTTCDAVCRSGGHSSGAIFQGTCQQAVKPGVGNICR